MNKEMQKEYYKRDIVNYLEMTGVFFNSMKDAIEKCDYNDARQLLMDSVICTGNIYKIIREMERLDSST